MPASKTGKWSACPALKKYKAIDQVIGWLVFVGKPVTQSLEPNLTIQEVPNLMNLEKDRLVWREGLYFKKECVHQTTQI